MGVLTLAAATPAAAAEDVPINTGNVPTTAKQFEDPDKRAENCKDIIDSFVDLPGDTQVDGWHFILPGNTGDFEEIRLTFKKPDNTEVKVTIEGSNDDPFWLGLFKETGSGQVKHAYLLTEPGWTLTAGEADVDGEAEKFNLSHTCAGIGEPSTPPGGGGGSGTPTPSGGGGGGGGGGGTTPPGGGGGLPVTGAAVGGMVVVGMGLLAAGIALMAVRRRRDIEDVPEI